MIKVRQRPLTATRSDLVRPSEAWTQRAIRRGVEHAYGEHPRPIRNDLPGHNYERRESGRAPAWTLRALAAALAEHGPSPAELDDNPEEDRDGGA